MTKHGPVSACAVRGVRKSFGGVLALAGVDIDVHPGTVHAIVGENGAGKSTLMRILAGAESPDEGEVFVDGREVRFDSVADAARHSVAIVFQELSLYPDLDVLANLFVTREPGRFGVVSRRDMRRRAAPVLKRVGLDVALDRPVEELTLGERQLVEIARALLVDARILILDEPNSALNSTESGRLFEVVRTLRDQQVAVIFVSHRLEEVFAIADVITVMRNGEIVDRSEVADTTISKVIVDMIGREPAELERRALTSAPPSGDPLVIERVTVAGGLRDVSLRVEPGEIVGLAGLEGSGAGQLLKVLFGTKRPDRGSVRLGLSQRLPRSAVAAVRQRTALVPADRRNAGVALTQSVRDNLVTVTAGPLRRYGRLLRRRQIERDARGRMAGLRIQASGTDAEVHSLSGGNQQKVVLGKWLEAEPRLVLLDDPTRGVDVGAKVEIYGIVEGLAAEGKIVLITSSELRELVLLCDRVVVFFEGEIVGEYTRELLDEHVLLEAINTGRLGSR